MSTLVKGTDPTSLRPQGMQKNFEPEMSVAAGAYECWVKERQPTLASPILCRI